jgi:hypothetical protein
MADGDPAGRRRAILGILAGAGTASLAGCPAPAPAPDDDDAGSGRADTTRTLGGPLRAMEAVSGAVSRAAERAERRDRGGTDRALETLADNLKRAVERFDGLRDTLPEPTAEAADRRFRQAQRRTEEAAAAATIYTDYCKSVPMVRRPVLANHR